MNELIKNNIEISNMDLLVKSGLADKKGINEKYYTVYTNYKILLDRYLVNRLNLDVYDKSIDESGYKFIPIDSKGMDYYQYMSAMNLKYLYLRNNLYIEKLSKEVINRLLSLTTEELNKPSEELIGIVEATYKSVIDKSPESDGSYMARYGPDNDKFWYPSNELIIGLRYDMFADNGLGEDDEWKENNEKQLIFINALIDEVDDTGESILGIPVNVILYTDYTIKEIVNVKE